MALSVSFTPGGAIASRVRSGAVDTEGPDPQRPLTPGEALAKFFLDNADRGRNAANDVLIERIVARLREVADHPYELP